MKEDAVEYCDEAKIKELAGYHSEFLTHPIHVMKTETHQVPKKKEDVPEGDADEEDLAISKRCGEAPALLISEQHGMSANMERVIKSQARATGIPEHSYKSHRVFEFNPRHPFIIKLNEMVTPDEDSEEDFVNSQNAEDLAWLIHDTAVLNSGYTIQGIPTYMERMNRIIQSEMGLDDTGLEDEIEPEVDDDIPDDEEENEELNMDLPPGYTAGEPEVLIP